MSEHLDHNLLHELKEVMGNDFGKLVDTFISDSDRRIDKLRKAIEQGDSGGIREVAHSFKGSAANLAAGELSSLCQQLEHAAREGELANAADMFVAIHEEYVVVRQLISDL